MSDTDTITIAGHAFSVPVRYTEGHELTEGEASALNQTYHENLRNNFAKKVKDAGEGIDLASMQAQLDTYAESYAFGVRVGGGGAPRDPIMSEALNIAKGIIRAALKKKGKKADPKAIGEAAKKLVADPTRGEAIMASARERVAEAQAAAGEDLSDLIAELPEKAPAPAKAAA